MFARPMSSRRIAFVSALLSCSFVPLQAQVTMSNASGGGALRLMPNDLAILETPDPRKDLPCSVISNKPILGFDLRFHAGYEVSVPLKEIAGRDNLLTILFRVVSEEGKGNPVYFTQKVRVPTIEEDSKGDAYLQGSFDLGEGKYHVDWLMRDRTERVCSSYWDFEAALPPKDKNMALAITTDIVQQSDSEQFREEPPVLRLQNEPPLNLKVLINFAPQNSKSATLQPLDTSALVSILRSISRDPRVGKFSLVAFNLQEQRIVYRADNSERIDFPALGEALTSLKLGTVDLGRLSQKHGDTDFLTDLIRRETTDASADAIVFAGPKAMLEENVPQDSLKQIGELRQPVFYMNYNLYPQQIPWNDSIGKAVKFLKGYEYTISKPRDLWFAVTEMVSRIAKLRQGRRNGTSSSE